MKKNRTYRTNAFLAMMLAGSFLAGTTSLASESKAGSLSEAAASQQQNRTVTGKVVDASGQGTVGIGVMVKGTSNGTLTNPDGTFTLSRMWLPEPLSCSPASATRRSRLSMKASLSM